MNISSQQTDQALCKKVDRQASLQAGFNHQLVKHSDFRKLLQNLSYADAKVM